MGRLTKTCYFVWPQHACTLSYAARPLSVKSGPKQEVAFLAHLGTLNTWPDIYVTFGKQDRMRGKADECAAVRTEADAATRQLWRLKTHLFMGKELVSWLSSRRGMKPGRACESSRQCSHTGTGSWWHLTICSVNPLAVSIIRCPVRRISSQTSRTAHLWRCPCGGTAVLQLPKLAYMYFLYYRRVCASN